MIVKCVWWLCQYETDQELSGLNDFWKDFDREINVMHTREHRAQVKVPVKGTHVWKVICSASYTQPLKLPAGSKNKWFCMTAHWTAIRASLVINIKLQRMLFLDFGSVFRRTHWSRHQKCELVIWSPSQQHTMRAFLEVSFAHNKPMRFDTYASGCQVIILSLSVLHNAHHSAACLCRGLRGTACIALLQTSSSTELCPLIKPKLPTVEQESDPRYSLA